MKGILGPGSQVSTNDIFAAGGLSLSHISPHIPNPAGKRHFVTPDVARPGGVIEYTPHGSAWSVKRKCNRSRAGGGSRKGVGNKGRTAKSRKHARDTLDRVDDRVLPLLVTLTYPDHFPTDPKVWKDHLDKFARRMARHFPEAAFFWVIELQDRKTGVNKGEYAPHYHLLVWGADLGAFSEWMPLNWYEVCGRIDRAQIEVHRHGDACQQARSAKAASGYVAKYVTKAEAGAYADAYPDGIGGWWGIRGRKNMPWADSETLHMTERGAKKVVRLTRKYIDAQYRADAKKKGIKNSKWGIRHHLPYGVTVSVVAPSIWARVVVRMGWAVDPDRPPEPPRSLRNGGHLP